MIKRIIEQWMARRGWIKIPGASGSGGGYGGFLGWTNVGSRTEQLKAYQNHVYKCVSVIYRRVMSIPYRLYVERNEDDEEVTRHPLLDLLWSPNPYMSGAFLIAITQMHMDLTGMAFWLKVRNGLGRPAELWPLSPALFSRFVLNDTRSELVSYEFLTDTGAAVNYAPSEIVYFHYPHPIYWLEGASPIQAMAYSYDIDLASRIYQRNFFQNSARPDMIFESDQEISPEDARRLLIEWKGVHQGVNRSWEPAVLDKGLKANILSSNAKDMEFVSLANWTKEDILEAYNVPPGKLGTVADVNRANGVALDITFNSECIKPKLGFFDETVSRFLAADFDPRLYLLHDECVPRDEDFDLRERESNLRNKVTSINEERQKIGLEDVEWGNVPWISIAEIQYGESPYELNPEATLSVDAAPVKPELDPVIPKASRDRTRLTHDRRVASRIRPFRARLRKLFNKQKQETLRNLDQVFPRIEGVLAGMSIKKTKLWLDEHKDMTERILFNIQAADTELTDAARPYLENNLIFAGELALNQVGAQDIVFDLYSERARRYLGDHLARIRDANRTTQDLLRDQLRQGFESGETMQQMAARINQVFDNADKVRSLRIAQTETNAGVNFGTFEGYKQSGVVAKKEWIAGPGARPTHQDAENRYTGNGAIPIDEDFHVGAGRGPAPGNIGLPEEDIN